MTNVAVEVPQELLDQLETSSLGQVDPAERVRVALAIHLFLTEAVSIGRAAELSGMGYMEFFHLLIDLGLPTVVFGPEEWAEDMKTIEQMERESRAGRGR